METTKVFDSIYTSDGHEIFWLHAYDITSLKTDIDPDDLTLDKYEFLDKCEEIVKESLKNPNIKFKNYSVDDEWIEQWKYESLADKYDAKATKVNDFWKLDFSECYAHKDDSDISMNDESKKWELSQYFENGVKNIIEFDSYDNAKSYDAEIHMISDLFYGDSRFMLSYEEGATINV